MPTRPSLHLGTPRSPSPRPSSNGVNEVISAVTRKFGTAHIENTTPTSPAPRRSSLSMDSILHPKKDKKKSSDEGETGSKDKRLSLSMRTSSKTRESNAAQAPHPVPARAGKFDVLIESPPLVFIGGTSSSTGALLSGRLKLTVENTAGEITLDQFTMVLRLVTCTSKPVGKECMECKERYETINEWTFLRDPKCFRAGQDNQFPFSYLLQGRLPATTISGLGSLKYQLKVVGITADGERIELIHSLLIQRAIPPGPDKSSIRIFPPTNLTGRMILPPVVHPIGTFPIQMTLSGVVERKQESQNRWRLRKAMWRIEEHTTMISVPCAKHSGKVGDGKGIQHVDTKVMGHDEMKSGWKSDFDTVGGEITLEFEAAVSTKPTHKPVCDVDSSGMTVKHNLVVELIVAEEFCPNRNPNLITPTGAARILRMQFSLLVTERAGMGISWDEEMPPMYEDVPASPPGYGSSDKNDGAFGGAIMEDYHGPELEYVDLERMQSENPADPPVYRERDAASINSGLPMRESLFPAPSTSRRRLGADGTSDAGPSSRPVRGVVTLDDLGAEPPQYALRQRQSLEVNQNDVVEDFGEGETG